MQDSAGARTGHLRDACVAEARAIIAETGLESLSLREVARRLGVSHGAPYRHYATRDHLLAEVIRRAYLDFAAHLAAAAPGRGDPAAEMHAMGLAYLDHALAHPLEYRLMFGTKLPDPAQHPAMMASAHQAFALLRAALRRRHAGGDAATTYADALFVWSALHGLAGTLRSDVVAGLDLAVGLPAQAVAHVLARIGTALDAGPAAGSNAEGRHALRLPPSPNEP
jgi:AcrR family transcriptional regulator